MKTDSRIFVAGQRGMVGSAIERELRKRGFNSLIKAGSDQLDLREQAAVNAFFEREKPEYIFLVAARVGGIHANSTYPADFIYDNLMIEANVIHAAHRHAVRKLQFLGSSCIYPKMAAQPIREEYLLSGPLEPTNQAYALAKIAGLELCKAYRKQHGSDFISLMPTNLYGPNDNYHPENSHVIPGLIRRFEAAVREAADEVVIWGSGSPRREFLYVDDLAEACVHTMLHYSGAEILNVGTGSDISIMELAELIAEVSGFEGRLVNDTSKPDGTPLKRLDVSRIHELGWKASTPLREGLEAAYRDFLANHRETA